MLRNEDIYEALSDDGAFEALPSRLAEAFGARSCVIHWHYDAGEAEVLSHSGYFSPEQMMLYGRDFAGLDPWAQASAALRIENRAQDLAQIVSPREFERSRFYNDYIRAIGDDTFHCVGVRIANQWGAGMLALHRGRSQEGFSADQLRVLDEWLPHLRRMLAVRGRIAANERSLQRAGDSLDALALAILTVDGAGRLVDANAAADAMLRSGRSLGVRGGIVCAGVPHQDLALKRAIHAAATRIAPAGSALRLADGEDGPGTLLTLLPLRPGPSGRSLVLLLVGDAGEGKGVAARMAAIFGLSPAEAFIAERLAQGWTTVEIAAARRVMVGTLRLQIKSLMAKLGCRRQSEVVALFHSFPRLRADEAKGG